MSEPTHRTDVDGRESASLTAGGERKGIEIVTSQEMPHDWQPPAMGLGTPPAADHTGGTSNGE